MTKGIWQKILSDTIFEGEKVPSPEERKKMYDLCYRRVVRYFKKLKREPTKYEMDEALEKCLRDKLYTFQMKPEPPKPRKKPCLSVEEVNRRRQERELEEEIRLVSSINRNFWESEREDLEKKRKEENEKLKKWVKEEFGYG